MLIILAFSIILAVGVILLLAKRRNMLNWLPSYIRQSFARSRTVDGPIHLLFCFVDHYEPRWKNPDNLDLERQRVDRWMNDYPVMASGFTDADGCNPKHSFFYPQEEYRHEHLAKLSDLCARGYGEIEIHLHHEDDTEDNLRQTLNGFAQTLHSEHGALPVHPGTGQIQYAFIHGNWALGNSHPKGRFCGVDREITILKETGCYADYTFPSAPGPTQPSIINSIYYAKDDPQALRPHDKGRPVQAGGEVWGDLLLINGPLMLNWNNRKLGFIPRIENADIRSSNPPTPERVDLWVKAGIHVADKPEWRFVKIHTHGAQDGDMDTLLGASVKNMHRHLSRYYNDGQEYLLHYVSAREMYNIAKAAEAGKLGDPGSFRDYILPKPSFKRLKV